MWTQSVHCPLPTDRKGKKKKTTNVCMSDFKPQEGLKLVIQWRLKETERARKQKRVGRGERELERERERARESTDRARGRPSTRAGKVNPPPPVETATATLHQHRGSREEDSHRAGKPDHTPDQTPPLPESVSGHSRPCS